MKPDTNLVIRKLAPKYAIRRKRKDATTINVVKVKSNIQNLATIIYV